MRHIHHDTIISAQICGFFHCLRGLGVVEVDGYGDGRGGRGFVRSPREDAGGVGLRPGEEEEHGGGVLGGGGAHGGEDAFDVVDADGGDAVVGFGGFAEDLGCFGGLEVWRG